MTTANTGTQPRSGNYHRVALAAHALIHDGNGRLLLIRRSGTDYLDGYWSVPAGHVEAGETARAACAREVKEEVDLDFPEAGFEFVLVQQKSGSDGEERVDFFFDVAWDGSAQPTVGAPYELDAVTWADPENLPDPFAPYVRTALASIAAGAHLAYWDL